MVEHVTFIDAWLMWLKGGLDQGAYLGPFTIQWWGRIGKLVQFFAAMTLILEIIGPERLQQIGRSLDSRITWEAVKTYISNAMVGAYRTYKAMLPVEFPQDPSLDPLENVTGTVHIAVLTLVCLAFYHFAELLDQFFHLPRAVADELWALVPIAILEQARLRRTYPLFAPLIVPFVAVLVFLMNAFVTGISSGGWALLKALADTFTGLLIAMTSAPILSMLILAALTVVVAALVVSCNLLLIKPAALILRATRSERDIKVISVLLILLGFQFDLLAS